MAALQRALLTPLPPQRQPLVKRLAALLRAKDKP
jgi:hypothetical protein